MKRTVYSAVYDVSAKEVRAIDLHDGVYIEDVNGGLWEPVIWDGSVKPNSIVVINKRHSFRIALVQSDPSHMMMAGIDNSADCVLPNMVYADTALTDFGGAYNTLELIDLNPKTDDAVGWCDAYTFPDGSKGYLPALGELSLAYQNKSAIEAALAKCGGTAMVSKEAALHYTTVFYYSSTSYVRKFSRSCWLLNWNDGKVDDALSVSALLCVRPFATFSRRPFT